jgi:pimeloyl-ACP methyl ester carboxylesterase
MSAVRTILALAIAGVFILGCIGPVKHTFTTDFPAPIVYAVGTPPVSDGRTRFREIFCQILAENPDYQGQAGICENFLWRLSDEPVPRGLPGPLPTQKTGDRILVVPGFLNECFANIALPFEDSIESLNDRGYKIEELVVSGRSSSDSNAIFIADTIENLNLGPDEKLVLIGHSKGAVDILHFLVNYPEAVPRVAAVVSVAGAINGSPLAAHFSEIYNSLSRNILTERCDTGDDGAMDSLQPAVRLSWLAANPLPDTVRYFSVAAFTTSENINLLLKTDYDLMRIYGPRNDGLLLIPEQIIPGGTFLGYANGDHWSVVLPLEDKSSLVSGTVQASQKFPREVLLQAVLVYVAEALAQNQEQN